MLSMQVIQTQMLVQWEVAKGHLRALEMLHYSAVSREADRERARRFTDLLDEFVREIENEGLNE